MRKTAVLWVAVTAPLMLQASAGEPVISGAWVRAMPPTQSMTAGYLRLDNHSASAITVIGAASDASPRVEIHTTVTRDGMQRMQPVTALEIAAGDSVELAPGGYHLMLREMPSMPAAGDRVELCLELAGGERLCSEARVARSHADVQNHRHH